MIYIRHYCLSFILLILVFDSFAIFWVFCIVEVVEFIGDHGSFSSLNFELISFLIFFVLIVIQHKLTKFRCILFKTDFFKGVVNVLRQHFVSFVLTWNIVGYREDVQNKKSTCLLKCFFSVFVHDHVIFFGDEWVFYKPLDNRCWHVKLLDVFLLLCFHYLFKFSLYLFSFFN